MNTSVLAMISEAHWVVQIVMLILVLASLWTWTILIGKLIGFARAKAAADRFERAFWSGQPLDDLYDALEGRPRTAIERIFAAGMREWRRSFTGAGGLIPGADQRITRVMSVAVARESDRYERGIGVLATVGAVAPFIGLFGTVWGIKNSFESIAGAQSANLTVVAPGIAEALLATALGLLAAIPAVTAYNYCAGRHDRLALRLETFADEFATLLSRQLERGGSAGGV